MFNEAHILTNIVMLVSKELTLTTFGHFFCILAKSLGFIDPFTDKLRSLLASCELSCCLYSQSRSVCVGSILYQSLDR